MAKKQEKRPEENEVQLPPQPLPPASAAPVSNARIWVFWCAVALAVIIARVLNHTLSTVPESTIERWIMLAFAAFLGVFLLKLE